MLPRFRVEGSVQGWGAPYVIQFQPPPAPGLTFHDQLTGTFTAQMIHLPIHASWLNQVEVYFSVLQRKLLTPDDFEDLDELAAQILAFLKHYNAAATPFDWKFTRTDLNQLLNRLARHDPAAPPPLAA